MKTLDKINALEQDTVYLGAQNRLVKQARFNDPQHKSPRYTSSLKNYLRCFKCSYEYGVFSVVISVAISVTISVTIHEFLV